MTHRVRVICFLFLGLVLFRSSEGAVVTNGGFEQVDESGWPADWQPVGREVRAVGRAYEGERPAAQVASELPLWPWSLLQRAFPGCVRPPLPAALRSSAPVWILWSPSDDCAISSFAVAAALSLFQVRIQTFPWALPWE